MTHVRLALIPAAAFAIIAAAIVGRAQRSELSHVVVLAEYDGVIHPIAAEFFDDVIDRANEVNAGRDHAPHLRASAMSTTRLASASDEGPGNQPHLRVRLT